MSSICSCCQGRFPRTSPANYVSEKDSKAFTNPTARHPPLPTLSQSPVKVLINCYINRADTVDLLIKTVNTESPIQLVIRGVCSFHPRVLPPRESLDLTSLVEIMLSLYSEAEEDVFDCLSKTGANSLHNPVSVALSLPYECALLTRAGEWLDGLGSVESLHINIGHLSHENTLGQLVTPTNAQHLKALTLHCHTDQSIEDIFNTIPLSTRSLEYLEMNTRSVTLSLEMNSISFTSVLLCSNLRVLSISAEGRPLSELFYCIGQLPKLEFFESCLEMNIFTDDVYALHLILTSSLPKLYHLHMNTPGLFVQDSDATNDRYAPLSELLHGLLKGWKGNEACATMKFSTKAAIGQWLTSKRPDICFKLDTQERHWKDYGLMFSV